MPQTHCVHRINHPMPHAFVQASLFVAILILAGEAQAGEVEIEKLQQGLQSPNETTRVEAIKKFKSSAAEASKAAEVLVPLLTDKSAQVQQAASSALMNLGKEAVPVLVLALQAKEPEV